MRTVLAPCVLALASLGCGAIGGSPGEGGDEDIAEPGPDAALGEGVGQPDGGTPAADAAPVEPEEPTEEDYPTPTAALRFDVAGLSCPSSGVCEANMDQCFCPAEFEKLNYTTQSHFLGVATERHRAKIRSVGNYQAFYVNDLNHDDAGNGWTQVTAAARADEMVAVCQASFPTVCPQWFLVNEISSSTWQNSAAYRKWVAAVARRLKVTHGKAPIVFAPFATPGRNDADWQALAAVAHIGVENYLSGAEIKANGFSQTWCKAQYRASIDAYGARGVAKTRLILTEHFANTTSAKPWGRGGVSDEDWRRAIKVRSAAARSLDFRGFASYAWSFNALHEEIPTRLTYEELYGSIALP